MSTSTINISFQKQLLVEIDAMARTESRSRSELLREAARDYIRRKQRWSEIFKMGKNIAANSDVVPEDVDKEIKAYRKTKASKR